MENEILMTARHLVKTYGNLGVLDNVDVEIRKGDFLTIVGPSGAGKSTLLHILGTLDKPASGQLLFKGEDLLKAKPAALASIRNQYFGFVFQFHHLLPEFTALENVCMPAWIGIEQKMVDAFDVKARAEALLTSLNLQDRMHHLPSELSGGEQQRVAVARALMNQPEVIFADEPSGNLDAHNADELHQLFFDLNQNTQQTFVVITHNEAFAQKASKVLTMKDGRLL